MKKLKSIALFSFLLLTAILTGCGGGGGGGAAVAPAAPAPAGGGVTITGANAQQVTGATVDAATGPIDSGAAGLLTGAVIETSSDNINIVDIIISQIKAAPERTTSTESVIGVFVTEDVDCTDGGSISIVFNHAGSDAELSTGDTMTLTADNCIEDGVILNGTISIDNIIVTGEILSFPYTLSFNIQATNFSATSGGETVVLNGNMTVSESTTDGILVNLAITGSSIQLTVNGTVVTLTSFNIVLTDNGGAYTLDINTTINSAAIGGTVTLVTDIIFQGNGDADPYAGQATITGAGGTSVTLIALSSIVRLEIDSDGDGAIDSTIETTWANL